MLSASDPFTRSGLAHLYNLEYDPAIADFDRALRVHANDPFAVNHLVQAIFLKELYRLNALDTTLYADDGFLTGKPLPGDPKVKARIMELVDRGISLANERLKENPNDVAALYARGVSRGLQVSYMGIVEKSFFSALRGAIASRRDHEHVLQLNPNYIDAKLLVGVHNYIIGSLPLPVKLLVGLAGIGGSKKKGLEYLAESCAGQGETKADACTVLSLFLRREARYQDALAVARMLSRDYPKNFLFGLEEANLLKDDGRGEEAMAAYSKLLANGKAGMYAGPHLELAEFGLAESLKGQHYPEEALRAYDSARSYANVQPAVRIRATLGAGEMLDILEKREEAMARYREVVALDQNSPQAHLARKFLKQRFRFSMEHR